MVAMAELNKLVDRPAGGNEFMTRPSYGDFRTTLCGIRCEAIRALKRSSSGLRLSHPNKTRQDHAIARQRTVVRCSAWNILKKF